MFVFSFKASRFRLLFAAVLCGAIAFAAVLLMPESEHTVTVNGVGLDQRIRFDGIKDTPSLVEFAESLGFAVEPEPVESVETKIPHKFDALLSAYNDLQKSQGFNLAKYRGKAVRRSTFRVTMLPNGQTLPEDDVLLSLIVCKSTVIGGDLYFTGDTDVCAFLR